MLKIKAILVSWIKKALVFLGEKPQLMITPEYEKGEMSINDSILLCYLIEFNKDNELLNNPDNMLLKLIGLIYKQYEGKIELSGLIEIDSKIKAIIGKIIQQKAVDDNEYINCENIYLEYAEGKNADVSKV